MGDHKIRVVLLEPYTILRTGLQTILQNANSVALVGSAASGTTATTLSSGLLPDVIIVGLHRNDSDTIGHITTIARSLPALKILMIIANDNEITGIDTALVAGAMGIVMASVSETELISAISTVDDGMPAMCPRAVEMLVRAAGRASSLSHTSFDLTTRELEVLALVLEGLTNKKIASRLVVSPNTIKNHISSILSKLGVSTRTEAVAKAYKENLLKKSGLASLQRTRLDYAGLD